MNPMSRLVHTRWVCWVYRLRRGAEPHEPTGIHYFWKRDKLGYCGQRIGLRGVCTGDCSDKRLTGGPREMTIFVFWYPSPETQNNLSVQKSWSFPSAISLNNGRTINDKVLLFTFVVFVPELCFSIYSPALCASQNNIITLSNTIIYYYYHYYAVRVSLP